MSSPRGFRSGLPVLTGIAAVTARPVIVCLCLTAAALMLPARVQAQAAAVDDVWGKDTGSQARGKRDPRMGKPGETDEQRDARMAWWRDARFGMFIHWGLYSEAAGEWKGKRVTGGGAEWIQARGQIPAADYATLAAKFNPQKFDATEWVRMAKDAGMKYIVITAKHHDGFAMWRSKADPFNIYDATPFKRDPIKELADACRAAGIKLGFYYSQNLDWANPYARGNGRDFKESGADFPRYLREKAFPQMTELLTEYGDVCEFWFDFPSKPATQEEGDAFRALVWKLQPNAVINDRGGGKGGDYNTPEQSIPGDRASNDFESCMTMNETWGYRHYDDEWKSAAQLIRNLTNTAGKGGNFLLNVGPDAKGQFTPETVERLAAIGKWLRVNGESIYGTQAGPFSTMPWGRSTMKGKKVYLHIIDWPAGGLIEVPLLTKPESVRLLASGKELSWKSEDSVLRIQGPDTAPDASVTVIEMTLPRPPRIGAYRGQRLLNGQFELDGLEGWAGGHRVAGVTSQADAISGKQSAYVSASGPWDKGALKQIYQIVRVRPGDKLDFSAQIRSVDLVEGEAEACLELSIHGGAGRQLFSQRTETVSGENQSKKVSFDTITVPPNGATATVKCLIVRTGPKYSRAQKALFDDVVLNASQ